jgi:hypothetical protein
MTWPTLPKGTIRRPVAVTTMSAFSCRWWYGPRLKGAFVQPGGEGLYLCHARAPEAIMTRLSYHLHRSGKSLGHTYAALVGNSQER